MSLLVAIEGGDGAGKATAAAVVAARLEADGQARDGAVLPPLCRDRRRLGAGRASRRAAAAPVTAQAAAVLYALDRLESRPALLDAMARHDVVVLDRYIASNLAYQGAQAGDAAADLMRWAWALETETFALPAPDLQVYLETPVDVARDLIGRKRQRSYTDQTYDQYEADAGLQARVRENYAALAASGWAGRWVTVRTTAGAVLRTPEDIAGEIVDIVAARLG
jgi:dTMP kinase